MQGGTRRASNTPRFIQAIGVWLIAIAIVLSIGGSWLIRRFVQPDFRIEGWTAYKTWPEQDLLLSVTFGAAILAVVLILVGAALRLTRRSD